MPHARLCAALAVSIASEAHSAGIRNNQDYPSAAVAAGLHGSTIVSFDINETGRVENCKVLRSSGTPVLDDASCTLVIRRGDYKVSTDAQGTAHRLAAGLTVHWILANVLSTGADLPVQNDDAIVIFDPSLVERNGVRVAVNEPALLPFKRFKFPSAVRGEPRPAETGMAVMVDKRGFVEQCSVVRPSGNETRDRGSCDLVRQNFHFKAATDVSGTPVHALTYKVFKWYPCPIQSPCR